MLKINEILEIAQTAQKAAQKKKQERDELTRLFKEGSRLIALLKGEQGERPNEFTICNWGGKSKSEGDKAPLLGFCFVDAVCHEDGNCFLVITCAEGDSLFSKDDSWALDKIPDRIKGEAMRGGKKFTAWLQQRTSPPTEG
jgi:hypothetical protein